MINSRTIKLFGIFLAFLLLSSCSASPEERNREPNKVDLKISGHITYYENDPTLPLADRYKPIEGIVVGLGNIGTQVKSNKDGLYLIYVEGIDIENQKLLYIFATDEDGGDFLDQMIAVRLPVIYDGFGEIEQADIIMERASSETPAFN